MRIVAHQCRVAVEVIDAAQSHAALRAAEQRRPFVIGKVVLVPIVQHVENALPCRRVDIVCLAFRCARRQFVGMRRQLPQYLRYSLDREHHIGQPRHHRTARHAVKLRRFRILHDHHPSGRLDRCNPSGTVGRRAGQDHRHRELTVRRGQRIEQPINRAALAALGVRIEQPQTAVFHHQVAIGNADVHVIWLNLEPVLRGLDRERCMPGQQIDEVTFSLGIEMLHDQQCHAVQRGLRVKQPAHCLQTAGRCADPDDGIIRSAAS